MSKRIRKFRRLAGIPAVVGLITALSLAGASFGAQPGEHGNAGHGDTTHATGGHDDQGADGHGDVTGGDMHGDDHAAHGEDKSLFEGDIGNMVWTGITFAIVLLVLGKFAWGPILTGLQKREAFIRDSLEEARKDREEAQAKLRQYEAQIRHAKEEATAIVAEGRRDAEEVKRKIQEETRAESDAMVERAKREVALARDTAVKDLYDLAATLATDMASKVIRKELNPSEHERLIRESIDELEKLGAAGRG